MKRESSLKARKIAAESFIREHSLEVTLLDFNDNARDQENIIEALTFAFECGYLEGAQKEIESSLITFKTIMGEGKTS